MATDRQTIITLAIDLKGESSGIKELETALAQLQTDLAGTAKSTASVLSSTITQFNTVLKEQQNQAQKALDEGRVGDAQAIYSAYKKITESVEKLQGALSNLPFKQKFEEARAAVDALAASPKATSKTIRELSDTLQAVGKAPTNASEYEAWLKRLLSLIQQLTKPSIRSSEYASHFGADFVSGLRESINSNIIKEVFDKAFAGKVDLLQPLRKVLGSDKAFLDAFNSYVQTTFKQSFEVIAGAANDASGQLTALGRQAHVSAAGVTDLKLGLEGNTDTIQTTIKEFENFETVQRALVTILGISENKFKEESSTFLEYSERAHAIKKSLNDLLTVVGKVEGVSKLDQKFAAYDEYVGLVNKARTELASLKKAQEQLVLDKSKGGFLSPELIKKQEIAISEMIAKLQGYKDRLDTFDIKSFGNLNTLLGTQERKLQELHDELTKLNGSAPKEIQTAISSLNEGLVTAITHAQDLSKSFGKNAAKGTSSDIKIALANAAKEFGAKLQAQIEKSATLAQDKFKTIHIPPITLQNISLPGAGAVQGMFMSLGGVITAIQNQWDTFSAHLTSKNLGTDKIALLRETIKSLAPVMEDLREHPTKFGEAFNSVGKQATNNLMALDLVLQLLANDVIGIGTAFAGPRAAITALREQLNLTEVAGTKMESIALGARQIQVGISGAKTQVEQLGEAFKGIEGRKGPEYAGFDEVSKVVSDLEKKLNSLTRNLQSLKEMDVQLGGTTFQGALKVAIEKTEADLHGLKIRLAETLQLPLAEIKTNKIDESLSATSKEFTSFQTTAEKAMKGAATSFLRLEDGGAVFNKVETAFHSMAQAITTPGQMLEVLNKLQLVISGFQTGLEVDYKKIAGGNAKEAIAEVNGLIEVLREYINTQLATTRLKLVEESALPTVDTTLINNLKQQQQAYEGLLGTLTGMEKALGETQKAFINTKDVLSLSSKTIDTETTAIAALKKGYTDAKGAADQFNVNGMVTAFSALSTEGTKSVGVLDKAIKKLEELASTGYNFPKGGLSFVDVTGTTVQFATIQEYIEHLKTLSKQTVEYIETQAKLIAPLEQVKKGFDGLKGLATISLDTPIKNGAEAVNLLDASLTGLITKFHTLTAGVTDFGSLQAGYARHKQELSELFAIVESVTVALKQMKVGDTVSFGGGNLGVSELVKILEDARQKIVKESAAISVALQAGGASVNDYLLTAASGSRFKLIDSQIESLSTRILSAVAQIEGLGKNGAPIELGEVERLKTLVSSLVKERTAIVAEINSGIERMQTSLVSAQATQKDATNVNALKEAVKAAVAEFGTLITKVDQVKVSIGDVSASAGDISKMVTPILQFNEAISNLDNQLTRIAAPTSTFDLALQGVVAELKIAETQLGITSHAYESLEKVQLQSMSSDLKSRITELTKAYTEVTRSITAMEVAAKSNVGPTVDTTQLKEAIAKAEKLKEEMYALAHANEVLSAIIRKQPEGSNVLATFGEGVASGVEQVKGAGALLSKFMSRVFETVIKSNTALHGMGSAEEEVIRKTRLLAAAVQELETKMVTSLRSMDMMAMGLQMLGQAMVEPFKKSLESFSKFSDTMAFVQGATGATSAEMEELAKSAMIVGTTTRVSAQDAAEGLKQLALAGYDAEQSIAVLPTVVRLAQAAEMELGTTTEIVVNIMNSQRIGAEEIAEAIDVLAVAANRTTATVTDMGTAFKYIGALAGTIGNEFTDTAGAVALLHNAGLRGCYDDQTEVMTRKGFKLFKELKYEDEILTLNRDSLALEWQKPRSIVQYDVSEDLIYIRSGAVDLAVTKEHNLFIETVTGTRKLLHASKFKDGKFFRTGIWHGNSPEFFEIPGITRDRGGYVEFINSVKIPTARWVEFLGWYFSEGSLHLDNYGNYRIRITQRSYNKDFDSLKTCLESLLPFKFKYDGLSFVCRSVQLFRFLEQYGVGTFNKKVPDYVKEYAPDLIQTFLESYRKGDGDASFTLYTSNEQLAFDLQELGIKAGYGTSFNIRDKVGKIVNFVEGDQTRPVIATKPCYDISIATTHIHPFISKSEISRNKKAGLSNIQKTYVEERHYEGVVYCAEVPNHTMYVRRNGKGIFCGNSMAGTALRGTLQALLNPTKDEAKVMGELSKRLGGLGLQIMDSQGKFVGFKKIIEQFEQAGMTTAEVLELFGQRAGPGMAALLQMGSKQLNTLIDDLENAEGATSQLSANMEATFGGSVDKMQNSLEAFGEVIGHAIAGPLEVLANMVTTVAQKMVEFGQEFPGITAVIANFSGAVSVAFLALGSLAMAWTMMLVPAAQLFKFVGTITTVLLGATAALNGLTAATATQILINKSFGANLLAATTATGKFGAALIILKTIVIGIGQALLKPLSPFGLAMYALVGIIGAVTWAFATMKRDLGTVNAEFDKNRQIIANNITTFRGLRNQILDTANAVSNLRLTNKELTADQFINLPEFKQQKEQFLAQLAELNTRLKESDLGKSVVRIERFDELTGKLVGLTAISTKTGEVIGELDVNMLSAVGGAEALAHGMNSINQAMAKIGKQKIHENVIDQLAENLDRSEKKIKATLGVTGKNLETNITEQEAALRNLLSVREQFNKINEQLAAAEVSGDKKKYEELLKVRDDFLKENKKFGSSLGIVTPTAGNFSTTINNLIKDGVVALGKLKTLQGKSKKAFDDIVAIYRNTDVGKNATLKEFISDITEAARKSGEFSETKIAQLLPDMEKVWKEFQKSSDEGAKNVDLASSLEPMFRELQRQFSSFSRMLEETIKELTSEQEGLNRVLDKYQKSVDIFTKVRNEYGAAAKATLDTGLAESERKLTASLDHIVASAYTGYAGVAQASISWTDPASEAAQTEADKFRVIQESKVAIATASSGKMYNVFTTSLQKQMDDLERESKVTENVFTIPLRLEAVDNGLGIKRFVAGGEKASRELFDYQITINQRLVEAELYKEQAILNAKKATIAEEISQTDAYYNKVKDHHAEGTQSRMDLDKDYLTKQKEFNQKGVDATKTALDKLYDSHKKISDKIKTLKENESKFIASLDDARRKAMESGQNEFQKRDSQFSQIGNLFKIAEESMGTGQFDKALKAFEKIKEVATSIEYEPFDEETRNRVLQIYDETEKGYVKATAGVEQVAKAELVTIENLGKAMQENLRGFEAGVAKFAGELTKLATEMEGMKMLFASQHNIKLDNKEALAGLVHLEEQFLLFKRMLETPLEVNMSPEKIAELLGLVKEQLRIGKEIAAYRDVQQDIKPLEKAITSTGQLVALSKELLAVQQALTEPVKTKEPLVVGQKIEEMNKADVDKVNKALNERETILKGIAQGYIDTKRQIPPLIQAELDAVSKARAAFAEGGKDSQGYSETVARGFTQTKEVIEAVAAEASKVKIDADASMLFTLSTVTNTITKLAGELRDLNRQEGLDIKIRAGASTNLDALFAQLSQLSNKLNETQTVEALDLMLLQMKGYQNSLKAAADAGDETARQNIQALDATIKKVEELKAATNLSNQARIDGAKDSHKTVQEMINKQAAEQKVKVVASPETAKKAGEENAKTANEAAQKTPTAIPVVADGAQAKEAITTVTTDAQKKADQKPVMIGIAADPAAIQKLKDDAERTNQQIREKIAAGSGIAWGGEMPKVMITPTVDQAALKQELGTVTATAAQTPAEVPIKTDTGQLQVASKDVVGLREKLVDLIRANSQFKFFEGNKTTQQIWDLIKPLDALIAKKDEAGNIKFDVNDQSITQAANKWTELSGVASTFYSLVANGSEEANAELMKTPRYAEAWMDSMSASKTPEEYYGKLRAAILLVKKAGETPMPTIVPANVVSDLETAETKLTEFNNTLVGVTDKTNVIQFGLSGNASDELVELKTQLAAFQQQAAAGVPLDATKIEEFKTRYIATLESLKTLNVGTLGVDEKAIFDGAIVDQEINRVKSSFDQLKGVITGTPKFTVTSDYSQIDNAYKQTEALLALDGRTTSINVVANLVTNRKQGGIVGFQAGGLIEVLSHFADGGLAQIQRFANGGRMMFKRIMSKVPGVGSGDKVPAMLEPGEFVVQKPMVQRYGTGFMEDLNNGLLQFRALGGHIFNMPSQALNGLQQYVTPQYPIPEAVAGGPSVDVRLHLGGKVFNMKTPRDQVKDLVNATKSLERGY